MWRMSIATKLDTVCAKQIQELGFQKHTRKRFSAMTHSSFWKGTIEQEPLASKRSKFGDYFSESLAAKIVQKTGTALEKYEHEKSRGAERSFCRKCQSKTFGIDEILSSTEYLFDMTVLCTLLSYGFSMSISM